MWWTMSVLKDLVAFLQVSAEVTLAGVIQVDQGLGLCLEKSTVPNALQHVSFSNLPWFGFLLMSIRDFPQKGSLLAHLRR